MRDDSGHYPPVLPGPSAAVKGSCAGRVTHGSQEDHEACEEEARRETKFEQLTGLHQRRQAIGSLTNQRTSARNALRTVAESILVYLGAEHPVFSIVDQQDSPDEASGRVEVTMPQVIKRVPFDLRIKRDGFCWLLGSNNEPAHRYDPENESTLSKFADEICEKLKHQ